MRIVGGRWKGRALKAPADGDVTRPSTDRMREAVASMVAAACGLDLSDRSVLDAFAGSGALGLELLSRGAARATFCERDRRSLACVRANVASLGAGRSEAAVVAGDAVAQARSGRLRGPFDVVFLDPPYALDPDLSQGLLEALHGSGALAPGAVVVHERSQERPALNLAFLEPVRSRRHGSSMVELYRVADGSDDDR